MRRQDRSGTKDAADEKNGHLYESSLGPMRNVPDSEASNLAS